MLFPGYIIFASQNKKLNNSIQLLIMLRRDYLKKQTDRFAEALRKILAGLLLLPDKGTAGERLDSITRSLKAELDADLEELLALPDDVLVNRLLTEKGFGPESLEAFADLLSHLADGLQEQDRERRLLIYGKCLVLYKSSSETGRTFSFERHAKMERIQDLMR